MKQTVLYDEGYEYSIGAEGQPFNIQFDYGTRFNRINMQFAHFHPYYEIYFLLNGSSQHFVEGQAFSLEPYTMVLLKPFRLHRTNYFENNPCKRLIFSFAPNMIAPFFPEAMAVIDALFQTNKPIYRFSQNQTNQLIDLFNGMYKTSKLGGPMANLKITGLFLQLLERLTEFSEDNIYFQNQEDSSALTGNAVESKIYEITSYIHHNYGTNLTLVGLADMFYISPHYLSRQFKTYTGFTLIQYIQETRIKKAQELLLDTDMKIVDIIDHCGFGSISQFNRVFSELVGSSPSKYRKSNRL